VVPADTLVVVAHLDDDMIFMQPALRAAIESGSVTTVYVSSGDMVHADGAPAHTFKAARTAYESVARSSDWDLPISRLSSAPIHLCQLHDQTVSMIGLDTADGGLQGQYEMSPLHLVEGMVSEIPIPGEDRRAGDRGHDHRLAVPHHPGDPAQADSTRWTSRRPTDATTRDTCSRRASRSGRPHAPTTARHPLARGYNVQDEPVTLAETDYQTVSRCSATFEALLLRCGKCGTSCESSTRCTTSGCTGSTRRSAHRSMRAAG